MGKTWKVVICGQAGVGKTAILEQLVNADHVIGSSMFSTIEDIYTVLVDTDKNQKEKLHIYDTAGLDLSRAELPKHYLSFADGYMLVYDTTSESSFNCVDLLKKFIEKNKEKKEAVLVAIGNKCDLKELRQVDLATSNKWSQTEKIRLFEASVGSRQTIIEPLVWLTSKMSQPPSKRFPPFGEGKKKNEQSL